MTGEPDVREALAGARTSAGPSLLELSEGGPLLVVFLRHFGCTFCREAMADVREQRGAIESGGVRVALVHSATEAQAAPYLERFGLADLPRVADPERRLYAAFGLQRGSLAQLFGLKTWIRGLAAGVVGGHGIGPLAGNGFQMPGVFHVERGRIVRAFRHGSAADRPDYESLACPARA